MRGLRRLAATVASHGWRHAPTAMLRIRRARMRAGWLRVERELPLLPALVDPDRAAIDVGADNGLYTFELAALVPRVHAVEPGRRAAARLRAVPLQNVVLHEVALSDRPGTATLRTPIAGARAVGALASLEPGAVRGTRAREATVTLETLDGLGAGPVGFVKIDVEGHELAVLRGGAGLVDAHAPTFLIEAEERHRPKAVASVAEFLGARGYAGFYLAEDGPAPLSRLAPAQQDPDRPGGIHRADYVNNFIFVPETRADATLARIAALDRGRRSGRPPPRGALRAARCSSTNE